MSDCCTCRHAIWDYIEFYDPHYVYWFVCDCKIDEDPDECCAEYEEVEMDI